jgi:hypothetical protein
MQIAPARSGETARSVAIATIAAMGEAGKMDVFVIAGSLR